MSGGEDDNRKAKDIKHSLVSIKDVIFGDKLGAGAFGVVHRGQYRDLPVAIKEVDPKKARGGLDLPEFEVLQAFEWEVARLSTLSHINLVRFYGVCTNDEGNPCLVMELCQKESLLDYLRSARSKALGIGSAKPANSGYSSYGGLEEDEEEGEESEGPAVAQSYTLKALPMPLSQIWRIALEIAYGLVYLHDKGTMHRDLKSENILFGLDERVKLADLGVAQVDALISSEQAKVVEKGMKDFYYAAPEEFRRQGTIMSDMYSYGLIVWELVNGDSVPKTHLEWRRQGKPEVIPEYCPEFLAELMRSCWDVNPQNRPTARQAVQLLEQWAKFNLTEATAQGITTRACLVPMMETLVDEQYLAIRDYIASNVKGVGAQAGKSAPTIQDLLCQWAIPPKPASKSPEEKEEKEEKVEPVDYRACVVSGAGGLGKSLASYVLAQWLLARNSSEQAEEQKPLPIFLRPAFPVWEHAALSNGIEKTLIHYGITPGSPAMHELQAQKIIFILDGYDELAGSGGGNLPKQLGMEQWPNAKLLVSVRPDIVPLDKFQATFGPAGSSAQSRTLVPFGEEKVITFLARTLSDEEVATLKQQINQDGTILQVLSNPFVLSLFVRSWTSQKADQAHLKALTQPGIYRIAIAHWITTHGDLLPAPLQSFLCGDITVEELRSDPENSGTVTKGEESDGKAAVFKKLLHSAEGWLYRSAFAMLASNAVSLTLNNVPKGSSWNEIYQVVDVYAEAILVRRDKKIAGLSPRSAATARRRAFLTLAQFQDLLKNKVRQFFDMAPLKIRNGQQQFIHKTLLEYCAAAGIIRALGHDIHDLAQAHASGIQPQFILTDKGVLTFLGLMATHQDCEHWEKWIELSKKDKDKAASVVAASAITALNGLHKQLNSRDFRGISIPNADLRGAWLQHTNLEGANLADTLLHSSNLQDVSFAQANLEGADFGELPKLSIPVNAYSIVAHPDGRHAIVAGYSAVYVVDTQASDTNAAVDHSWKAPENGSGNCLNVVALSRDGKLVSAYWHDNVVRVWNFHSREEIRAFKAHTREVQGLAFNPAGTVLASCASDQTLYVWDLTDNKEVASDASKDPRALWSKTYAADTNPTCVGFSADGKVLAVGVGLNIIMYAAATGEEICTLEKAHGKKIATVLFSNDGQWLASASNDDTARLWSLATNPPIQKHKLVWESTENGHAGNASNTIAFSPNGSTLALATTADYVVTTWNVVDGVLKRVLAGHTQYTTSVAFSPSGLLFSGSWDNTLRVWSVDKELPQRPVFGYRDQPKTLTFDASGENLLALGRYDDYMTGISPAFWVALPSDRPERGLVHRLLPENLEYYQTRMAGADFCNQTETIISAHGDSSIQGWSVKTGQNLWKLSGVADELSLFTSCADGTVWAGVPSRDSCSAQIFKDRLVKHQLQGKARWGPRAFKKEPYEGHSDSINVIVISNDASLVATASKEVIVWDTESGKKVSQWKFDKDPIFALCFDPTATYVAMGSGYPGTSPPSKHFWVGVLEARTGNLARVLLGHTDGISAVCFAPTPAAGGLGLLASSSFDGTIRLWDPRPESRPEAESTETTQGPHTAPLRVLSLVTGINSVVFSRTGDLATTHGHTAQIWRVRSSNKREKSSSLSLSEHANSLALEWCSGPSGILGAEGCRLDGVKSLTHNNEVLLRQLGAK